MMMIDGEVCRKDRIGNECGKRRKKGEEGRGGEGSDC